MHLAGLPEILSTICFIPKLKDSPMYEHIQKRFADPFRSIERIRNDTTMLKSLRQESGDVISIILHQLGKWANTAYTMLVILTMALKREYYTPRN